MSFSLPRPVLSSEKKRKETESLEARSATAKSLSVDENIAISAGGTISENGSTLEAGVLEKNLLGSGRFTTLNITGGAGVTSTITDTGSNTATVNLAVASDATLAQVLGVGNTTGGTDIDSTGSAQIDNIGALRFADGLGIQMGPTADAGAAGSIAMGNGLANTTSGDNAIAIGRTGGGADPTADGNNSISLGRGTTNANNAVQLQNNGNTVSGDEAIAIGGRTGTTTSGARCITWADVGSALRTSNISGDDCFFYANNFNPATGATISGARNNIVADQSSIVTGDDNVLFAPNHPDGLGTLAVSDCFLYGDGTDAAAYPTADGDFVLTDGTNWLRTNFTTSGTAGALTAHLQITLNGTAYAIPLYAMS